MIRLFRRRYIAFKVYSSIFVSKRELLTILLTKAIALFGRENVERWHIRIIEYDSQTHYGIVRCNHTAVQMLRTLLEEVSQTDGIDNVKTVGISGSLRALKRKFGDKATI